MARRCRREDNERFNRELTSFREVDFTLGAQLGGQLGGRFCRIVAIVHTKNSDKETHGGPLHKQIDVETNLGKPPGYMATADSIGTRRQPSRRFRG